MGGLSNEDTTDALDNQVMVIESGDELSTDRAEVTAGKRLKVDAQFDVDPDDISACPVISNSYKIEYTSPETTVPSSFATMYSYNGTGRLFGFNQCYDDNDTEVRLIIDGVQIFSLVLEDIEDMVISDNITLCKTLFANSAEKFEFCPPCPIRFTSSVLIQARRTDGSNNELERQLIFISKES